MIKKKEATRKKKGYGVRSTLLTDDIHKKVGHSSLEMKMGRTGDGGIGRQKR